MMVRILFAGLCAAFLVTTPRAAAEEKVPEGFTALFDGKSLDGWQLVGSKKDCWKAEKGTLVCEGGGGGWLMSKKEYSDFELRLEYRLEKVGNSGVAVRSPLKGRPSAVGMEIQILDDPNYKNLKPTQHTGSIYGVVPPTKQVGKPAGEWNTMRIIAKGSRITVELNGEKIVDANLDDHKMKLEKTYPGLFRTSGHIGLQDHGGRLEFRRVFLRELPNR